MAFCRWGVEHAFRLVKTEIGFGHFEGRSWRGLLRHLILCQAVMLFVAEQRLGFGGKNPRLTMEQTARALNTVCRLWQERRRKSPDLEHVASVIRYHQAHNEAAKRSRLRSVQRQR